MRKTIIMTIILMSLVFVQAALALDFSADVVSRSKGGNFTGNIFVANDKVRMDMGPTSTITRIDKQVSWVLMQNEGMYMEQPLNPNVAVASSKNVPGEIERTPLGNEAIDGKDAKKYRITYESRGVRTTVLQWIDSATNIPVKTAAVDDSWSMEYKNLTVGVQPESIFEIPAGYQKFAMPNVAEMARAMKRQ